MEAPSLPPIEEVNLGKYTYEPCPIDNIPMPSHIFMHYFTTPSDLHPDSTWGPRLPQKLGTSLLVGIDPSPEGWGLLVLEGIHWTLLISFMIIFAIVGVVVAIFYSHYTGDHQTGIAIGAYMAALQSMGLALCVVRSSVAS
jgi:hypothetical protein